MTKPYIILCIVFYTQTLCVFFPFHAIYANNFASCFGFLNEKHKLNTFYKSVTAAEYIESVNNDFSQLTEVMLDLSEVKIGFYEPSTARQTIRSVRKMDLQDRRLIIKLWNKAKSSKSLHAGYLNGSVTS